MTPNRRRFILFGGRLIGAAALGGIGYRVLTGHDAELEFTQQPARPYRWRINLDKCTWCGLCETACVRKPSAVKAVNDQTKCSYCVACYGHLADPATPSHLIQNDADYVCPHDAVRRRPFADGGGEGYHLYHIDPECCTACGKCVKECNGKGTGSMFLIIRPDLCIGCHRCAIAAVCPDDAVERDYDLPGAEDDYRGEFELDRELAAMGLGGFSEQGFPEDCGEGDGREEPFGEEEEQP